MGDKKEIPLALLNILIRHTDENHILTTSQIIEKMAQIHDVTLERRTLYANIELLKKYGYQISDWHDNGAGYYLSRHQFSRSEVVLLCNAVHASHFISSSESNTIIRKLLETQSVYDQHSFRDSVYMPNPKKTDNRTLLRNMDILSAAIEERHAVQFTYLHYNNRKKLEPRREKPYTVEPRFFVFMDTRAYVVVTSDHHEGYGHYRIDRMKNVQITDTSFAPLRSPMDAYQYASGKFYMYTGETVSASFRCRRSVLDHMIDLFGTDLIIIPVDEEHFDMHVRGSADGLLLLAQQFLDSVTVLEPEELREKVRERIRNSLKEYE